LGEKYGSFEYNFFDMAFFVKRGRKTFVRSIISGRKGNVSKVFLPSFEEMFQ